MSDTFLREREDHVGVQEPHPEPQVYTAYVTVAPIVTLDPPLYAVAEDGTVTLVDTRPAPLTVETAEDGTVTIKVPA